MICYKLTASNIITHNMAALVALARADAPAKFEVLSVLGRSALSSFVSL